MKKISYILMSAALCVSFLAAPKTTKADDIDKTKARQVGAYFLSAQFGSKAITEGSLEQVYELKNPQRDIAALYVFNTSDKRGFVIVSGTDCIDPIVAYSTDGSFDPNNIPPNMMWWLNDQAEFINYAQNNDLKPTRESIDAWRVLEDEKLPYFGQDSKAITRLTTSKWNQEPLYNNMCPTDNGGRCVTGCVATAMAQILYYWKYPYVGKGSLAYAWNGTAIQVFFNEAYYNYDVMLDEITPSSPQEAIDAVALLSYHCGVSVKMDYSSESSGALSEDVIPALRKYFKYAPDSLHFYSRSDSRFYNPNSIISPNTKDTAWVNLLRDEILKKRPIFYAGHSPNDGVHARHAFVCDGWNSTAKTMHFNWGWGGTGDAWCNVYNSNLRSAYGYVFSNDHRVIIGITPPKDSISIDVNIVTVDNPTINEVYPNPASDQITVNYQLNGNANSAIQIFDIAGREVKNIAVSPASNYVTIAVGDLRPGVYVCRLQGHSTKFIVK